MLLCGSAFSHIQGLQLTEFVSHDLLMGEEVVQSRKLLWQITPEPAEPSEHSLCFP